MTNTDAPTSTDLPLVCDLGVLTSDQRERLEKLSADLFQRAAAIEALDNGYDITYPDVSPGTLAQLAEFVAYDSLCCAFLEHAIVVGPGPGPAHLRLTGGEGAREVIAAVFDWRP